MGQAAGGIEPFHQHLEGHVLVLEGLQAALAHLGQQLGEAGVPGHVDPQHQGVDEEPDQLVERGITPPGDREPHRHIAAGAELGQQHRQRGLHHHEAGRVVLAGHRGDLLLQRGRPVHRHAGAALVGDGRVGPIGGQLHPLRHPGQGVLPVGQLGGDGAVVIVEIPELGALPQRVIDILHRQRCPARGPALLARPVRLAEITHQRGDRPAVGGNVVRGDRQHVLVVGDAEKPCPQRVLGRQVERVASRCGGRVGQLGFRPAGGVDHVPAEFRVFGSDHHLLRCSVGRHEPCPQGFVAAHHVGQGVAQGVRVQPAAQPQRDRHVVHR
ncbi:hypothetical protein C1Y40_01938 [Mycobacterium talmoniae]|uniref:Uncharacterized protein n=1 Tax=Mycobacterium talmoniae TaxID=1858794 RepID=A0A2S8BMD2_9MYCO|nr:hypothetical protein C1Y40_01938 [Mycobacterium talmoniae]